MSKDMMTLIDEVLRSHGAQIKAVYDNTEQSLDSMRALVATAENAKTALITAVESLVSELHAAQSQAAESEARAKAWQQLFIGIALQLKCLPSIFPNGNEHVTQAIEALQSQVATISAASVALQRGLRHIANGEANRSKNKSYGGCKIGRLSRNEMMDTARALLADPTPAVAEIEAREARLVDALEFYANDDTYKPDEDGEYPIMQDHDGDKARAALTDVPVYVQADVEALELGRAVRTANLRKLVEEVYELREHVCCCYDQDSDCANWPTCNPDCPLVQLRTLAGIEPREDGEIREPSKPKEVHND